MTTTFQIAGVSSAKVGTYITFFLFCGFFFLFFLPFSFSSLFFDEIDYPF